MLLITIVCFNKVRPTKFSVKCFDFCTLLATQTENQLLNAICFQPKRAWLYILTLHGARRGIKEKARYVVLEVAFSYAVSIDCVCVLGCCSLF